MSSSLLLQQCPVCLVCLAWMVYGIGGKWLYSSHLITLSLSLSLSLYIYIYKIIYKLLILKQKKRSFIRNIIMKGNQIKIRHFCSSTIDYNTFSPTHGSSVVWGCRIH